MTQKRSNLSKFNKKRLLLSVFLIASLFGGLETRTKKAFASPGGIEFQWDADPNFVRLKGYQSSKKRMEKSIYYFFLRARARKTGILKLTIKIPDYFKAKISSEKLNLCHVKIGGATSKTRCEQDIPAVFEVNETNTAIDIYPDQPIPADKKNYAVVMKIKNPRKSGMFQFHGYAQSPGAIPISSYMGSWTFDVK